jgi:hypothetical protein
MKLLFDQKSNCNLSDSGLPEYELYLANLLQF